MPMHRVETGVPLPEEDLGHSKAWELREYYDGGVWMLLYFGNHREVLVAFWFANERMLDRAMYSCGEDEDGDEYLGFMVYRPAGWSRYVLLQAFLTLTKTDFVLMHAMRRRLFGIS